MADLILPSWVPHRRRRHSYRVGFWLVTTIVAVAVGSCFWLVLSLLLQ